MNEGAFSGEPIGKSDATNPLPASQDADGAPVPGSGWGDASGATEAPAGPPAASRKILLIPLLLLVVGVPLGVGVFAFMNPDRPTTESAEGSAPGELGTDADPDEVAFSDPRWIRPSWADSMVGMTAFELPAANDVPRANGRLRPTLGVT